MNEDITAADFFEQDETGAIIQEGNEFAGYFSAVQEHPAQNIMLNGSA